MSKSFENLRAQIDALPERRERVEQRKQAIRHVLLLTALREERNVTQQEVAETLGISQATMSHIEHSDNLYLSTLVNYVAALGGRLEITAIFPEGSVTLPLPPATSDHMTERTPA